MHLPALTLAARSLREDTRRWQQHVLRLVVGVVMLLSLGIYAAMAAFTGAPGREYLAMIVNIDVFAITLLGISHFSAAVVEEKEAGVLGLLRMTGLNAPGILLGKLGGRLWIGLLLLLMQVPFVALSVTLGGVSMRQVGASTAAMGAYLVLLGCLALLASVAMRTRTRAALASLVAVLLLHYGVWLVHGLLVLVGGRGLGQATLDAWLATTIFTRLGEILSVAYGGPVVLHPQVGVSLAGAGLCFLAAMLLFDRCTADGEEGAAAVALVAPRPLRPGRAWRRALLWKDYQFTFGGLTGLLIKVLLFAIVATVSVLATRGRGGVDWDDACAMIAMVGVGWLILEEGWHLSRLFTLEQRAGTWPTIGMLPMTVRGIAYQKVAGSLLALAPAVLFTLAGAAGAPEAAAVLFGADDLEWWFAVAVVALFWHLCAWYGLLLDRGALALALVTIFAGSYILFPFLILVGIVQAVFGHGAGEAVTLLLLAAACVALHLHCGRLIRRRWGM